MIPQVLEVRHGKGTKCSTSNGNKRARIPHVARKVAQQAVAGEVLGMPQCGAPALKCKHFKAMQAADTYNRGLPAQGLNPKTLKP